MSNFYIENDNIEDLLKYNKIYGGKVRDVYQVQFGDDTNKLIMLQTDRLSAFDYNICNIDNKGCLLTNMSSWWFKQVRHIMPNHYLDNDSNSMLVKKCKPIKLEIIVRSFITGSLWRHYEKGNREYCGVQFPDGLKKNIHK